MSRENVGNWYRRCALHVYTRVHSLVQKETEDAASCCAPFRIFFTWYPSKDTASTGDVVYKFSASKGSKNKDEGSPRADVSGGYSS